jgi:ATP-dependent RNA helicase RhlE
LTFRELNFCDPLLDGLDAMRFEEATPIQEQAIPVIQSGRDLIACAQTGTGKTAAFLLPVLNELTVSPETTVNTLILVPTRELAIQIDQALEGFSYFTPISSLAIYGGRDGDAFNQEKKALRQGANVIIATPGRLISHLNLGYAKFDSIKHLILDEADRMLDMGFVNDIKKIIKFLPKKRQTLMFSATMSPKINQLARGILHQPESISLANARPAEGISQGAFMLPDHLKMDLLTYLLDIQKATKEKMLVFASTKVKVKQIRMDLSKSGLNAAEIHSDLEQDERREVLRKFHNGTVQVLVATDILARGIDVKDIDLVINYDLSKDPEDFVHRIGRTARAEAKGSALALVSPKEKRYFQNIERLIQMEIPVLPLPPFMEKLVEEDKKRPKPKSNYKKSGKGRHFKSKRGKKTSKR